MNKKHPDLFDDVVVNEEWTGMPEFIQERQKPHAKIIVRFECEKDLQDFAKLIGQKLTAKTQSIWHPKLEFGKYADKRWVSEK